MKKVTNNISPIFLPLALTITLMYGLFYVVTQQVYRISANDPQIQIAEDIATQLGNGNQPQYFIPSIKIDISKSLGTFIYVFDATGKILGSSAVINDKVPKFPQGVFASAKQKEETRFTWQPQGSTRIALVMVHYKTASKEGYVAIGRSLRETEIRIDNLTKMIFIGWVFTLASVFLLMYLRKRLN
jgi:hypothetical protein